MSTSFRLLFSPQRLRNCEIRNRILSTGHQTYLAKGNMPQDDFIAYHEKIRQRYCPRLKNPRDVSTFSENIHFIDIIRTPTRKINRAILRNT